MIGLALSGGQARDRMTAGLAQREEKGGSGIVIESSNAGRPTGAATGALIAGAVAALALPSAVLAFSARFEASPLGPVAEKVDAVPEGGDPAGLAASYPLRSLAHGSRFPFTPAGTANRPTRSVTVAVRVDTETARAISVRGTRIAKAEAPAALPVGIAPTGFNLGISRGYQNFVQGLASAGEGRKPDAPDIAGFALGPGKPAPAGRFSPRIVIDEQPATGRAPRTFAAESDAVDVGGSYRLTRNLNVTAGVRYSQERERLRPLTDGNPDSQAVYVGTQFRF